jgi:hypothetical protein
MDCVYPLGTMTLKTALLKVLTVPLCYLVAIPSAILSGIGMLFLWPGAHGLALTKRLLSFATFRPEIERAVEDHSGRP